ncbi:MAG: DNA phosphorothioation system restriction enzyme [Verrucomicrobia bacterium]|nr:MAG: DNA phosphorothioation system restriction enzyme [Verrucomicrobiota bacterium]
MPSLPALAQRLRICYRSGRDDLLRDFYIPCMECATLYRRAVGYFTSSSLASAARGVASLVSRHGKMQLVASPHLEEADIQALELAKDNPTTVLRQIVARSLSEIEDLLERERLNALAWLIADGSLEVRLAIRLDENGRLARGIYHEKIGIFTDAEGNNVAFAGSANETAAGLVDNFESIKVFWSWDDLQGRVKEELINFELLWSDRTPGLRVLDFTAVSKELLQRYQLPHTPELHEAHVQYWIPPKDLKPGTVPPDLTLREYQKDAIREWLKRNGRGILSMATGTGKTITALYLACKVAERNRPLVLLVVAPYLNLAKQWGREMARFGISAVPCFEGRARWELPLQEAYQRLAAGMTEVIGLVVTNDTFLSTAFQAALQPKLGHHLLVADEVHNLGAAKLKTALPDFIQLRLGLSATPERRWDEEGTKAIFDYFGDIAYEFTIADAIKANPPVLCPYFYYPVLVDLTAEESDRYYDLTLQLCRHLPASEGEGMSDQLLWLLIKRARLLASAANKLPALSAVLKSLTTPPTKAIVYCGDGRVEQPVTEEDERQIRAVSRLLGEEHGLRVRKFTYEEPPEDREAILAALRDGSLDAVVAIRCLDEGIDIPEVRLGFLLASSTNPRQFVQRRGRLLRRAPGKDRAIIYDFIVRPPTFGSADSDKDFNAERRLFGRELERILDFCASAENGPAALNQLHDLRLQYNLLAH